MPLPSFPYGAVYFRKSNPPREDWARDYATAAEDGLNTFRHWFLWSAIEVAPGEYDWDDYDRQLDLAAKHGIATIIAEMITAAPEWAYRRFAHARLETRDGRKVESGMSGSCVTGGFPGLCLDNDDYREAAGRFLEALAARYRGHPGLGGYDIWNECGFGADVCYCPATAARFRDWLKGRYRDLCDVGRSWQRYSFETWDDVHPPRFLGPYPEVRDWLQFRVENATSWMRWRRDLIRRLDSEHPVTAHGVAGTLTEGVSRGTDDWRAAAEADSYGFTWVACRKGDEPWKHFHAVDLVRGSARGKTFWHSEAQAGPLWMQPQVIERPREDGRIASPEDVRFWHLTSFMGGAKGLLLPRWRPLLDGPLFGAFGAYGMDGGRTPRSEMMSRLARWANAPEQRALWAAEPVKGEIGVVHNPGTQAFLYAQQGSGTLYAQCLQGAWRAFFDANIQADFVRADHIADYDVLYLPVPVAMSRDTAARIARWVSAGGTLISEGCPAYWDEAWRVDTVQPGGGLGPVFGAREVYVEFTPDLLGHLPVSWGGGKVRGGVFLQAYEPAGGTATGHYEDGQVAVVDHAFGKGRTRLIGTMAGAGYGLHAGEASGAFFAGCLELAGKERRLLCSDNRLKVRVHEGGGRAFLWIANSGRQDVAARITMGDGKTPSEARTLWGGSATVDSDAIVLTAPGRDITILEVA